jgi:hypothetical protein
MLKDFIEERSQLFKSKMESSSSILKKTTGKNNLVRPKNCSYTTLYTRSLLDLRNYTALYNSYDSLRRYYKRCSTDSLSDIANENYYSYCNIGQERHAITHWYYQPNKNGISIAQSVTPVKRKYKAMPNSEKFFEDEPVNLMAWNIKIYNLIKTKRRVQTYAAIDPDQ